MDSRTEFYQIRYDRLGFGETDKSALETLIARAEEALKGEYTNESLYQLKKVLAEAKEVLADESAKQPTVDQTAQKLQKALDNLEQEDLKRYRFLQESCKALTNGFRQVNSRRQQMTMRDR